jgi:hypothetical protein
MAMNEEQAVVLAILLNHGAGIISKAPDYIREKVAAVLRGDHPERLLDHEGRALYDNWHTLWVSPVRKPAP